MRMTSLGRLALRQMGQLTAGILATLCGMCGVQVALAQCTAGAAEGRQGSLQDFESYRGVNRGPGSFSFPSSAFVPDHFRPVGAGNPADMRRAFMHGDWSNPWSSWHRMAMAQVAASRKSDRLRPTPTSEFNSDPQHDLNPVSCQGVVLASGELTLQEQDAPRSGLYPMSLERTYRSAGATGRLFGPHWVSNVESIVIAPSAVWVATDIGSIPQDAIVSFPGGASYRYTLDLSDPGSYYVKQSQAMGTLRFAPQNSRWYLERDKRNYTFAAANRLSVVTDLDGARLSYSWQGSRLKHVENHAGFRLAFTYNSWGTVQQAKLTSPGDTTGLTWTFEYHAPEGSGSNAVPPRLKKSTPPAGALTGAREYLYHPTQKALLVGVKVDGVQVNTVT